VPFGGLRYVIVSQFAVQKHKENINISIYPYMPSTQQTINNIIYKYFMFGP